MPRMKSPHMIRERLKGDTRGKGCDTSTDLRTGTWQAKKLPFCGVAKDTLPEGSPRRTDHNVRKRTGDKSIPLPVLTEFPLRTRYEIKQACRVEAAMRHAQS